MKRFPMPEACNYSELSSLTLLLHLPLFSREPAEYGAKFLRKAVKMMPILTASGKVFLGFARTSRSDSSGLEFYFCLQQPHMACKTFLLAACSDGEKTPGVLQGLVLCRYQESHLGVEGMGEIGF